MLSPLVSRPLRPFRFEFEWSFFFSWPFFVFCHTGIRKDVIDRFVPVRFAADSARSFGAHSGLGATAASAARFIKRH